MKKLLSLLLACLMLTALVCTSVGAEGETTATEPNKPVGTTALTMREAIPVGYQVISSNLLAPAVYSQYSYTQNSLTAKNQWELGRYLSYGISVMGVSALERPISGAVDGIWSTGNVGDKLQNNSKAKGAFSYIGNGLQYNHKGETDQADSIYELLITFNFGKLATLDSLGFVVGKNANGLNNMPQAADVYTSCDGENWTLIGYWDRTAARMNGGDLTSMDAALLGVDGTNAEYTDGRLVLFDLGNTEAQFLRICATAHGGKSVPADATDYRTYSNVYTDKNSWRETLVYGTLLDKENTVTAVETPWVEPETDNSGDSTDDSGSSGLPDIPVKDNDKNNETTDSTATTETPADSSSSDNGAEEKKGCGSVVSGFGIVALLSTVGAGYLLRRRKED